MKKRILIIGSGMKPFENANGICTEPLMRELCKKNQVFYLDWMSSGDNTFTRADGIVICGEMMNKPVNQSSKVLPNNSFSKIKNIKKILRYVYERVFFPFKSLRKTNIFCKSALKICKDNQIDIVVAIYQPFNTLFAGYYVKKRNVGICFIPYYIDLISNPYIAFPLRSVDYQRHIMKKWENRVNSIATHIVYMIASKSFHEQNSNMKAWYKRITYFDIPLFDPQKRKYGVKRNNSSEINILFCGYIGEHRNISFFLDVLKLLPSNVKLTFVGNSTPNQEVIIRSFMEENPDRVSYIGYVPYNETAELLESADCFLNFGVVSETAISAKIYEYISYGKPIIMTYSIDREASVNVLKKYPLSFLLDERCPVSEELIEEVYLFLLTNQHCVLDDETLNKEFVLNKAETFAAFIDSIT